jgi:hypothetical protein
MRPTNTPRLALLVMPLFVMAGMIAAIGQSGMAQAADQPSASPLTGQVDVGQVSGGFGSSMAWTGFVESSRFAPIFEEVLRERGLSGAGGGRFVVSAEMLEFTTLGDDGFNFEGFASASVRYRVTTARDKAVIFETLIQNTVGVKAHRDAGSPNRPWRPVFRLAAEKKAIRKNISKFIDALMERAMTDPAFRSAY